MKNEKKQSIYDTCPICGGNNYRPHANSDDEARKYSLGHNYYLAAVRALKNAGLTPAEGHTDEAFSEALEAGDVDPWSVCMDCAEVENVFFRIEK